MISTISTNEVNNANKEGTEISRGYSLNIPEIGDLLIAHNGDIILTGNEAIKSIHISSESNVLLNNVKGKDVSIEAKSAYLIGKNEVNLNSLIFRSILSDNLTNGLFIDKESKLTVGNLLMENALLINTGCLEINGIMNFNSGIFSNAGTIKSKKKISCNLDYFINTSKGNIETKELEIKSDSTSNFGEIKAEKIKTDTEVLNNSGNIKSEQCIEITGSEACNEGIGALRNAFLLGQNVRSTELKKTEFFVSQ